MARRPPRSLRIAIRGGIALVVVALIATAAVAATSTHGTTYRTAIVARASVNQELHLTGTIEPVAQATVAFPIAGTVAAVAVKVGQTVATGQTLATLEVSSLQAALTTKEATLADAELTLHKVLNGESVGGGGNGTGGGSGASGAGSGGSSSETASASAASVTATTTTTTTTTTSAATTGRGATGSAGGTGSASTNPALAAARQAVTRAQGQVGAALAAAQAALHTATVACAAGTTTTTTTPTTTTTTPTTTTPTTTTPTTAPTGPPSGQPPSDQLSCAAAQAAVLRALDTVAGTEQSLAKAESTLGTLLASTNGSSSAATPSTTPTATQKTATPQASTTVTYTAEQVVAYEAAVAAAGSEVAAAQQDLAQARIVSPISGTIAAVDLAKGTAVTASSSTANVVIVSNGGDEVSTTVTVANRAKLKVGDTATVVADGSSVAWAGRVVAIGVVATSGTSTSYPVVVGFTNSPTGLRNGASAALTISVAETTNALTVPTSAVQTAGTMHTVTVLTKGKPSTVRVQVGTVGAVRTAITSGLQAGQIVALAELGAAIPSSGTSARTNTNGAFGGGLSTSTNLGGGGFGR